MLRVISWALAVVAMAMVAMFAATNHGPVFVMVWWPLDLGLEVPLYAAVLGGGFLGFLFGVAVTWLSAGPTRRRARDMTRRAEAAEADRTRLKEAVVRLEAQTRPRAPTLPSSAGGTVVSAPPAG